MDSKEREPSRNDAEVECPDAIRKSVGDETYIICSINSKPCLVEYGYDCDYYNEYLKEVENEN